MLLTDLLAKSENGSYSLSYVKCKKKVFLRGFSCGSQAPEGLLVGKKQETGKSLKRLHTSNLLTITGNHIEYSHHKHAPKIKFVH